jgi:asparagine N-glycosylation enzyme membrane subunit Stt3
VRRHRNRAAWLIGLAAILALAAWVRVDNYPQVLGRGELAPQLDGDSSYHLHRIEETLRHYPAVPHFDPGMNWPRGAFSPWSDGFDLSGATFARLVAGADPLRRRIAIALWPAILGVLVVWATARLVRVVVPAVSWRGAALAAALATALLPEFLVHSSFGRIDHHVVEALVLTLLVTWSLRRLPGHPGEAPLAPLALELEGALISGLGVWCFTGTPLYVALAALPFAWAAWSHGRVFGSGGPGLVGGGLLSATLSLPAVADHGLLISFKYPSLLQPLLLVAAGLGISAVAWAGGTADGRRGRRTLAAAGSLVLAFGAMVAVAPGAIGEVRAGLSGWLLHHDAWLETVGEFRPLIRHDPRTGWDFQYVYLGFGWAGFAAPLLLAVAAAVLWKRPRGRWLIGFAAAAMGLTLLQGRFGRVAAPLLGVVLGLALAAGLRGLARKRHWLLAAPIPALLLFLAFFIDIPTRTHLFRPPATGLEPVLDVAFELRDLPPPADLPRGVLSNWSYGHQLQVQSGLPVVVNGFGSYLDEAAFWKAVEIFRGEAGPFDDYLRENRIGVVVAGAATIGNEITGANDSFSFKEGALNQPYMASIPLSPLLIAGSAVPNWNVPHVPHLMPRASSRGVVRGLAFPLPFLWSYERVPGATVRGTAPRGQRVVAELRFKEQGRPHTYKAYTDAGGDGRWSLQLPFPSGLLRPTVRSEGHWTVAAAGGAPLEFALPEAAVRSGATLDIGRLEAKR